MFLFFKKNNARIIYNSIFVKKILLKSLKILLIILLIIAKINSFAQIDSSVVEDISAYYLKYGQDIYNPETFTYNFSYNYSNKWDLDGDGAKDSLYFIGNGGAHTYFYLRIILSSDKKQRDYPTFNIDMPYITPKDTLDKYGISFGFQFAVADFNKDGIDEIYLNVDNTWSSIPKKWKRKGVKTKHILLNFKGGKQTIKDYIGLK